jgi:hypothetical protein
MSGTRSRLLALGKVCGQQISNSQIEYEPRGIVWHRPLRFHIKCFTVWQLECAQRIDTQGGSPPRETPAIDDPEKTGENGDGTHRSRSCSIRGLRDVREVLIPQRTSTLSPWAAAGDVLDNGRQCSAMTSRPVTSHLSPGNDQRHGIHQSIEPLAADCPGRPLRCILFHASPPR